MEYVFKCRKCGKETDTTLKGFDVDKEQSFPFTCGYCGKKTVRTFPSDFEIDSFYKSLSAKARLLFQKYVLEKKSFPQISKETGIPITTCHHIYTKQLRMRSRNFKQAAKNHFKQKK